MKINEYRPFFSPSIPVTSLSYTHTHTLRLSLLSADIKGTFHRLHLPHQQHMKDKDLLENRRVSFSVQMRHTG